MANFGDGFFYPLGEGQRGGAFRFLYFTLLIAAAVALLLLPVAVFTGIPTSIALRVDATVDALNTEVGTVAAMLRGFELEGFSYYIFRRYAADAPAYFSALDVLLYASFFMVFTVAAVACTYLKSWRYYVGMVLMAGLVVGLQTDTLMLFGFKNGWPVPAIVLWLLLPLYLIHAFFSQLSFMRRWAVMALNAVFFTAFICFFSEIAGPIGHLVAHGQYAFFVISVLFVWLISYDILFLILFLTTDARNAGKKSSLINFLLAGILFLVNVVLAYLHNTREIDWDIVYINAFLLLMVSMVVGFWALSRKRVLYEGIFSKPAVMPVLYLALAAFLSVFCAYHFFTANDPGFEVLEDVIIYTHLATGVLFMVYVSVEFMDLFLKNKKVHTVVFTPRRMPFAIVTAGACVGIMAMLSYKSYFPYNQVLAARANAIADYALHTGSTFEAEQYYKEALAHEFQNHKSNYSLACMAASIGDVGLAKYYFSQALLKNPLPHTYLNLGNLYADESSFFNALDVYRSGLKAFPGSHELMNNLGLMFSRTDITDSVAFYFGNASEKDGNSVSHDNLIADLLRRRVVLPDSVLQLQLKGSQESLVNRLAYYNLGKTDASFTGFDAAGFNDSLITGVQVAFINNFYLNNYMHGRSNVLDTALLNRYLAYEGNERYDEQLNFIKAHALYRTGRVLAGIELMERLAKTGGVSAPFYAMQAGLLYLEQGLENKALHLLEEARYGRYKPAARPAALLAMRTLADKETVADALNHPFLLEDVRMAVELSELREDLNHAETYQINDDRRLLQALVLGYNRLSQGRVLALLRSIRNEELRSLAGISVAEGLMAAGDYGLARQILDEISPLKREFDLTEKQLHDAYVRLLMAEEQYEAIGKYLSKSNVTAEQLKSEKYLKGLAEWMQGDTAVAVVTWQAALNEQPYNEQGVVMVGELMHQSGHWESAYHLLQERLLPAGERPVLLMAYTLQCLRMNMAGYAQDAKMRTDAVVSSAVKSGFDKKYALEKLAMEERLSHWQ